jgi:glucose-6-phosphate dehydrogenase assembly protein OpcA
MTEALIGSWSSEDTTLPEVLGRLERLRRDADRTASRAAVVNLVVVAAVNAAADRVVASVAGLGAHHPGRIVVLVPESPGGRDGRAGAAGAAPGLAARIELRESDATGRQLWWEVVLLRARGPVCGHLESLMQPLLLHDLPVALWLAGGASTAGSPAVVAGAHQVIVSGERAAATGRADVASDLAALAAERPLADLAWLAIEPARRALARLFDPPERRAGLPGASVAVTGPPWSSRLLAAWLVERAGIEARRVTLRPDPEGAGRLGAEIDLEGRAAVLDAGPVWPAGAAAPASPGPGAARAWLGPATVVVPHGGSDTPRLLAAALTHPGRDLRYEAALAVAAGMF